MDALQTQTAQLPSGAGYHYGQEHAVESPTALLRQLQQHPRYLEYSRQIKACLAAPDGVWSLFHSLRTHRDACDFLEDLHLSIIYLIPPSDIYDLVVSLRSHPSWPSVRSMILTQVGTPRHQSSGATSSRSSALSNRSYAGLSYASGRSTSTAASYNLISVEEAEDEDQKLRASQTDVSRGTAVRTTVSGKLSKRAPEGSKFVCPHSHCRVNNTFSRRGDWTNHLIKFHQGAPDADPYEYLRPEVDISPQTPSHADQVEFPSSHAFSPFHNGLQISTVNDFSPTGPEYRLPMHQLSTNGFPIVPHAGYFGKYGVHAVDTSTPISAAGSRNEVSHFDDDDDMDEKEW